MEYDGYDEKNLSGDKVIENFYGNNNSKEGNASTSVVKEFSETNSNNRNPEGFTEFDWDTPVTSNTMDNYFAEQEFDLNGLDPRELAQNGLGIPVAQNEETSGEENEEQIPKTRLSFNDEVNNKLNPDNQIKNEEEELINKNSINILPDKPRKKKKKVAFAPEFVKKTPFSISGTPLDLKRNRERTQVELSSEEEFNRIEEGLNRVIIKEGRKKGGRAMTDEAKKKKEKIYKESYEEYQKRKEEYMKNEEDDEEDNKNANKEAYKKAKTKSMAEAYEILYMKKEEASEEDKKKEEEDKKKEEEEKEKKEKILGFLSDGISDSWTLSKAYNLNLNGKESSFGKNTAVSRPHARDIRLCAVKSPIDKKYVDMVPKDGECHFYSHPSEETDVYVFNQNDYDPLINKLDNEKYNELLTMAETRVTSILDEKRTKLEKLDGEIASTRDKVKGRSLEDNQAKKLRTKLMECQQERSQLLSEISNLESLLTEDRDVDLLNECTTPSFWTDCLSGETYNKMKDENEDISAKFNTNTYWHRYFKQILGDYLATKSNNNSPAEDLINNNIKNEKEDNNIYNIKDEKEDNNIDNIKNEKEDNNIDNIKDEKEDNNIDNIVNEIAHDIQQGQGNDNIGERGNNPNVDQILGNNIGNAIEPDGHQVQGNQVQGNNNISQILGNDIGNEIEPNVQQAQPQKKEKSAIQKAQSKLGGIWSKAKKRFGKALGVIAILGALAIAGTMLAGVGALGAAGFGIAAIAGWVGTGAACSVGVLGTALSAGLMGIGLGGLGGVAIAASNMFSNHSAGEFNYLAQAYIDSKDDANNNTDHELTKELNSLTKENSGDVQFSYNPDDSAIFKKIKDNKTFAKSEEETKNRLQTFKKSNALKKDKNTKKAFVALLLAEYYGASNKVKSTLLDTYNKHTPFNAFISNSQNDILLDIYGDLSKKSNIKDFNPSGNKTKILEDLDKPTPQSPYNADFINSHINLSKGDKKTTISFDDDSLKDTCLDGKTIAGEKLDTSVFSYGNYNLLSAGSDIMSKFLPLPKNDDDLPEDYLNLKAEYYQGLKSYLDEFLSYYDQLCGSGLDEEAYVEDMDYQINKDYPKDIFIKVFLGELSFADELDKYIEAVGADYSINKLKSRTSNIGAFSKFYNDEFFTRLKVAINQEFAVFKKKPDDYAYTQGYVAELFLLPLWFILFNKNNDISEIAKTEDFQNMLKITYLGCINLRQILTTVWGHLGSLKGVKEDTLRTKLAEIGN